MAVLHRVTDVLAQPLVRPADVVLGQLTFVTHHRTGAAAGLREPFSTAAAARASLALTIPVTAGASSAVATTRLRLRGPGDVLGLDPRQVVRRFPEPGVHDAVPSDLVHVELDAPDLPWQFTPTGPDAGGRLPPWLRLVVVEAADVLGPTPGRRGLPDVVDVPLAQLPPPDDAWAWAHAQVLGPVASGPTIAARLSPASPATNLARLLCPRHLAANKAYVAALVPTFEAGRLAGLGTEVPVDARLGWAWGPSSGPRVQLPVYDLWHFATGADGSFEALAEQLLPVVPPEGVGRRSLDTGSPGSGLDLPPGDHRRDVYGPLVRLGDPTTDGRSWPAEAVAGLRTRVEGPDRVAFGPDAGTEPEIGPTLYAGAHLARATVPAEGEEPAWARTLNLDPADRVVAGLGARVVQMDQDELMTSAWAQVHGVVAANAAISAAALGRYVTESLHRRHFGRMAAADLLVATARAHSRTMAADDARTVAAQIGASALPPAVVGPVLRRLARPSGPVARFAGADAQARVDATRALRSDEAGATRSWVRAYAEPDGVRRIAPSTVRALTELLGQEAAALEQAVDGMAAGAFVTTVGTGGVDAAALQGLGDLAVAAELGEVLRTLLGALPSARDVDEDPGQHAAVVPVLAGQVLAVLRVGESRGIDRWSVWRHDAERLELGDEPDDERPGRVLTTSDRVREVLTTLWEVARQHVELDELRVDPSAVEALGGLGRTEDQRVVDLVRTVGDGLVVDVPPLADPRRESLVVGDLGLLARLDPRTTAVRRLRARLRTWPAWLPGDWFDDTRLERVMVAPRFDHPMYEALDRYDREWLLPGVGGIDPQQMVTLLATNPRFVEAFLVGLNTEMARELLWREYPTDGRATSFRSFWTTQHELLQPVHAMGPGELGTHLDARHAAATVLLVRGELVRRYPDVLVHAIPQTAPGMPPDLLGAPATTLFRLHLAPDMLLVGLDLPAADVIAADDVDVHPEPRAGSWWLVLSEHVGQPRFGLDDGPAPGGPRVRDSLTWGDFHHSGSFLSAVGPLVDVTDAPAGAEGAAWLAWTLFQQPSRVGFRAARMVQDMS